jgi:hypothetical protein
MERAPIAEVQPSLATFGCKVNLFPLTRPEEKINIFFFDGWGFIRTFAAEGCETACARQSMPASLPSLKRSFARECRYEEIKNIAYETVI